MRHSALLAIACAGVFAAAPVRAQEDYGFDAGQFEKKRFELNGYAELRAEHFALDPGAAFYRLNFFDQTPRSDFARGTGALELTGVYREGMASLHATAHGEASRDYSGSERDTRLYEAYLRLEPARAASAELGKKALRWGKGYAWNPVGFVERPKDPNDPELSREGFVVLAGDLIRSFDGRLKTLALTPVLLPVRDSLNDDFGAAGHVNAAAKLYALYGDTDLDLVILGAGSRGRRYGFDFARNLTTNFEIHGEWARTADTERAVTDAAGNVTRVRADADSYLLGLRHLTENEVTTIVEYYRNGAGYTQDEMRAFFERVHTVYDQFQASGDATALGRIRDTLQTPYARPTPMGRYLYLRVSAKEPFDILYFTPAITLIDNLDDRSYSAAPELLYTGVTDLELRLRLYVLRGERLTEFGEKQNDRRVEFRVRYFF